MFNNFHETLQFTTTVSGQQYKLFNGLHLLAILACWLADLPFGLQWVVTITIVGFWMINHFQHKLVTFDLRYTKGGWQLSEDRELFLPITILETTVVTKLAIFLQYKTEEHGRKGVIISHDSLSASDFRRLMVKLKLTEQNQSR